MNPDPVDLQDIRDLLEENRRLSKENNRLLKQIRRDGILGLVVRVIFWLLILGVPIFFLSSYLAPIVDVVSGKTSGNEIPAGFWGLPSGVQIDQIQDIFSCIQGNTAENNQLEPSS